MYCEKVFKNRGFVQVTDRDSDLLAHPSRGVWLLMDRGLVVVLAGRFMCGAPASDPGSALPPLRRLCPGCQTRRSVAPGRGGRY